MKNDLGNALRQLKESLERASFTSENFSELHVNEIFAYQLVRVIYFVIAGHLESKCRWSVFSSRARSSAAAPFGEPHQKLLHCSWKRSR